MGPDFTRALDLAAAVAADTDSMSMLVMEGTPTSKKRPRVLRSGRTYSPSQVEEERLAWLLKARRWPKRTGNLAVGAIFYRPNHQRIDVDNMLKLVLDAGTKAGLWVDDAQITALLGVVEYDKENPRTVLVVAEHRSSLDRSPSRLEQVCERCGKTFKNPDKKKNRRFCSLACHGETMTQEKVRPGQGRGKKGQPPASCVDCGATLSKRSYVRCRACWKIARSKMVS